TRLFDATNDGRELFATAHLVLFCIIWIFVPLAAVDCISKERREGTLGLLFLTPLKPWDVVIAKSLVQASRALFMWLAAVPVLTLSLLMGGVTKWEVGLSVLIHFSSLCCALAAGIIVSGMFTERSRGMVFAVLVSVILLIGYLEIQLWITGPLKPTFASGHRWFLALVVAMNWGGEAWAMVTAAGQTAYSSWLNWMLLMCFASILLVVVAVLASGLLVRRSITSEGPRKSSRLAQRGSTVIFPALHRAWSRRRLDRNPIGWLEQRTWTARMCQWGWTAIILPVYAISAAQLTQWDGAHSYAFSHRLLGWGLLAALGMTAAASFWRERENGMLSLLLVTPLAPDKIVMGRVKGLWAQIRWATVLFVAGWIYLQTFVREEHDYFWMFFFTVSYLTLPVTGLFCSLWRKSYFAAVLWTLCLGIIYPLGVAFVWSLIILVLGGARNLWPTFLVVAALVQIAIAFIRGRELIRKLESRSFAF
ncbi:MAG TPA: hypothetical protein VFC26_01455, partial [Verrucomicrobiae bacterium]|nr:hypothetical protein [Verrucomicrobiae bacterium]